VHQPMQDEENAKNCAHALISSTGDMRNDTS
jgi:hypothetical protein